ncbi:hypothetical protein HK104_002407 [Borealophlyctis nickersoniae]|nr:hypothetical protein HK104_002407 [Borealophlyctis nickersoniae]
MIMTGMFAKISYSFPFFTPPLQSADVADAIAEALDGNRNQDIYLPFFANFMPIVRMLPWYINDWLRQVTRVDEDAKKMVL